MDIFSEAGNLVRRYEKGDAFRQHVRARMTLVVAVLLVFLVISTALSLGLIALMDKGAVRAFLAVVLMPIVLIGSFFLQAYVFFSWLELRALRPMLAHRPAPAPGGKWLSKLRARLGKAPPVPWIAAAVLLLIPFGLLMLASLKVASLILVLAILTPIVYAHLDR